METFTNSNHQILLEAAQKLGLKTEIISINPPKLKLSSLKTSHLITSKSFGLNSTKSINLSRNKSKTIKTLQKQRLPTPRHLIITQPQQYPQTCQKIPFPHAIKPLTGQKGKNVFLNIANRQTGLSAVKQVLNHSPEGCLIEPFCPGEDYRFLVLNFQVIGVVKRLAPQITGDGQSTIKELIDRENARRFKLWQTTGRRLLNRMRHWPRLRWYLQRQNLSLETVLAKGKTITLYPLPNFSTGGTTEALKLSAVPACLIKLAETAARLIGLTICGVDMIVKGNQAVIIELNSDPGLRLHDWPNSGKPQQVAEKILSWIFHRHQSKTVIN